MSKRYTTQQLEEMYLKLTGVAVKLSEDEVEDAVPAPDDLPSDDGVDGEPDALESPENEEYELPYGNLLVVRLNGPDGDLAGLSEYLKEVISDYFADREVQNGAGQVDVVDNPAPEEEPADDGEVPPVDDVPADDVTPPAEDDDVRV